MFIEHTIFSIDKYSKISYIKESKPWLVLYGFLNKKGENNEKDSGFCGFCLYFGCFFFGKCRDASAISPADIAAPYCNARIFSFEFKYS